MILSHSAGHRAHACIRYLVFEAAVFYDKDYQNIARINNLREGIRQLLRLLPHHLLKGIETPTLLPLDEDIISVLATTQANLVSLSFGPMHGSYLALQPTLKHWPQELEFLEAQGYFGDEQDITSYREIMKNSPNLKEVVLRHRGSASTNASFSNRAQDTETSDGLFFQLSQNRNDSDGERCNKLKLSILVL